MIDEITRTKKELAFATKQLNRTVQVAEKNKDGELEKSMKVVETIGIQKRVLEDENEELKSRISELIAERENLNANTRKRLDSDTLTSTQGFATQTYGVPPLNIGRASGRGNSVRRQ